MGLTDFIAKNMDLTNVDTGISGLNSFGILGNKILNDAKKMQEENHIEHSGKYCLKTCPITEVCPACLKAQEEFDRLIHELEVMEAAMKNPSAAKKKKIVKCSLCGAPYEKGEKMCSYCDTPYPSDGIGFDIPETEYEQQQLILELGTAAYEQQKIYFKLQMNNKNESLKKSMPGFLHGITGGLISSAEKMMELTPEQLLQGAKQNNMCLSAYIRGLNDGSVKNVKLVALEEERQRMNEQHQRDMQIQMQADAKKRQLQNENYQRMLNMTTSSTPKYSGGASRSCYNCTYYSAAAGACAQNGRSTSAGDYCALWKLK